MILVKVGGRALMNNMEKIVESVIKHRPSYDGLILVHGGGDLVDEWERRMGMEPKFYESPSGIKWRYTDERELEVFVATLGGLLNKKIVSEFQKRGVNAIGLTGADGRLVIAERKKRLIIKEEIGGRVRKRVIEGGYTGKIVEVNSEELKKLVKEYVVVMAPIALGKEGELLNVNADQMAAKIAIAVKPEIAVFLTDVDGVFIDGKLVNEIRVEQVDELVKKIGHGMNRKVLMAKEVAESGVKVVISNGTIEDPIGAVLEGKGTWIVQ